MPSSTGGAQNGGPEPEAWGGATAVYRQGGYAGQFDLTWGIVGQDGNRKIVNQYEVCAGVSPLTSRNAFSLQYWAPDSCRAGSLCSYDCLTDADCESDLPGPLPTSCAPISGSSQRLCILRCDDDTDCSDGMYCGDVGYGLKSCVLSDMLGRRDARTSAWTTAIRATNSSVDRMRPAATDFLVPRAESASHGAACLHHGRVRQAA